MRCVFLWLALLLGCDSRVTLAPPKGGGGQGGAGGDGAGGQLPLPCSGLELAGAWLTYGVQDGDFCVLHALDASDPARAPVALLRAGPHLESRVWSRDGRSLAYTYYDGDWKDHDVLLATFDESGLTENVSVASDVNLTDGAYNRGLPAVHWACDSQSLAFGASSPGGSRSGSLGVLRPNDGSSWSREVEGPPRLATTSADGASLFFSIDQGLYWASVGAGGIEQPLLVGAGVLPHDGDVNFATRPQWLSDQRGFVYGNVDQQLVLVTLTAGAPEVSALTAVGRLGPGGTPGYIGGSEYDFAVHPPDAGAVFVGRDEALDIYWVGFAGAPPIDLSGPDRGADSFVASPVGDAVAVFSEDDGVLTVAHAGEAPEQLSVDLGAVNGTAAEWSSDGEYLLIWAFDDVGAPRHWLVPYQAGAGPAHGVGAPIEITGAQSMRSVPGARGIVTVDAGSTLRFLPFVPEGLGTSVALSAEAHHPIGSWISPDGEGVLYLNESSGVRSLYWASLEDPGALPVLVGSRPDLESRAAISPDGSGYWVSAKAASDVLPRLLVGEIVDGSPTPPVEVTRSMCELPEWR